MEYNAVQYQLVQIIAVLYSFMAVLVPQEGIKWQPGCLPQQSELCRVYRVYYLPYKSELCTVYIVYCLPNQIKLSTVHSVYCLPYNSEL